MAGFQTFPSHHPPPHAEPSQAIRTQLGRIERGPRRSFGMAQGRSLDSKKKVPWEPVTWDEMVDLAKKKGWCHGNMVGM